MKPYLITTAVLFAAITVAHAYGAIAGATFTILISLLLVSAGSHHLGMAAPSKGCP